ncbi:hypothetical protein BKA63DRAFT_229876 [Paraphoma chrysanthemicola]|nr:hypothetical protein BKA63DRAFT_229876 [Paraphoma chrysanthemicola]
MAPRLRARPNTQGLKTVASDGNKRKRDGGSHAQSNVARKKKKGEQSIVAVPDKKTTCQKAVDDERIIKDLRITFHPKKFSPQRPGNVPEQHQTKFKHIQQLGRMVYESYAEQPRADITNKPWELENKLRALRVSEKATQARNDWQNEDGWRMELENRIFERFEIEVACQQCRRRLWQSAIQANPADSNSRTNSLEERQACRSACRCEQLSRRYSILSTGLSHIFTTRIGERSIIQDDSENIHRIEMQPDRIYGLRTTDAIDKILQQPGVSHLREDAELDDVLLNRLTITCNPDSGGRASIYPFLVMEAKSEKGGSSFQKIEQQTALPIRNHLYLQLKLQEDDFNRMQVPGGPLTWFLAYVGEMWRVYGCYVTKTSPDGLPYYNIVLLWQGSITGDDEALQLVLIVDYIVDWARDIYRPSIMRQLMSVVDKGARSSYTIIEEPDILSIPDVAKSWCGDGPVATISGAGTAELPTRPVFDATNSTIESSLKPVFKSTGKHVDIMVWDCAKYEARVRGLYITGSDARAEEHLTRTGYQKFKTRHMDRCWFILSSAQDIKTIEQAWTGSLEIKDVQDHPPQRILISLYVQYRKDGDGALIRELTYLALTESVATHTWPLRDIVERNEPVVSAEELGLKLREAWASNHKNYFRRYASGDTSVLCVTASDYDRLSDRVVLSFHNDREIMPYARRLNSFIETTCERTCEMPRAELQKIYAPCFRHTKAVHSLIVEPHCISDPTQACVFIDTEAKSAGICAYITNAASEEFNITWMIRHLVQMIVVLWDCTYLDIKNSFYPGRGDDDTKILLWIVSDHQWDMYRAIKSTLTMPGMNKVHEHLAWFRKVLLRHKCATGAHGSEAWRKDYRNVQHDIQVACKSCNFKLDKRSNPSGPVFGFCDEDFMLDDRWSH